MLSLVVAVVKDVRVLVVLPQVQLVVDPWRAWEAAHPAYPPMAPPLASPPPASCLPPGPFPVGPRDLPAAAVGGVPAQPRVFGGSPLPFLGCPMNDEEDEDEDEDEDEGEYEDENDG